MTLNPQDQAISLHDAAAQKARAWRWLQDRLVERRAELVTAAVDRLAATEAIERVMVRLCFEEGAAMGRMLRAREQLGRRPSRHRQEGVGG